MKKTFPVLNPYLLTLALLALLLSCQKEKVIQEQKPQPLNSFSMRLNGQVWQPSQIGKEVCMRTFHGAWSAVTENSQQKPFYTISAYKDPQAKVDYTSENAFKFQISNVKKTGLYEIKGSYTEDFSSYALFTINKPDGTYNRYVNKITHGSFFVEVSEFIPTPASELSGIRGTFYGTLYNEKNPLDSLIFQGGEFTLKKINWYNFNQCAQ
ncbi:MAG: DUF5025 domain-containing protein [Bacteroidota bacterium]